MATTTQRQIVIRGTGNAYMQEWTGVVTDDDSVTSLRSERLYDEPHQPDCDVRKIEDALFNGHRNGKVGAYKWEVTGQDIDRWIEVVLVGREYVAHLCTDHGRQPIPSVSSNEGLIGRSKAIDEAERRGLPFRE